MKDVAELARVSIATVSFVVNETKPVSPATRARILSAMEQLNFRRNVVARALASRRTRIIALLFPSSDHRLGGTSRSFVTSAANTANERGYNLVLWPVDDGPQLVEMIAGGLADGIVMMEVHMDDPRVERVVQSGVPFALIGRNRSPGNYAYVDIDFERTAEESIDYFIELGHEHIALIIESHDASPMGGFGPPVRTKEAYTRLMLERGLEPVVVSCDENPISGRAAAAELLSIAPRTTAIIVMNEDAAFGIVSGLNRAGLSVPGDVSILSISTTPEMGSMSDPVLSTMSAPGIAMGRLGVEALIDQLEGKLTELPQVLIPCTRELADSTAPPPSREALDAREGLGSQAVHASGLQ